MAGEAESWPTFADVLTVVRRRWDRGVYLRARAEGLAWEPVVVPVAKGPVATNLTADLRGVVTWAERFMADSASARQAGVEVQTRSLRSKAIGANDVPARIVFGTFEVLVAALGVGDEVSAFDDVLAATSRRLPAARDRVVAHHREAIEHRAEWGRILDVVCWIVDHDVSELMLRHLDLPGIDTKFVERHRKVLVQLLDLALPAERVDVLAGSDVAARYGFRPKPSYVQFRVLSPVPELPAGLSELTLRADELSAIPLSVRTVFIVENHTSYLAFPPVKSSIVVFGQGFKVATVDAVRWLADRDVVYWGDIDTYGFSILDQLRRRVPGTRSMLMDRETLLAHTDHVGVEERQVHAELVHLTEEERALYADLIEDRFGRNVRLEQERIRFGEVRRAVERMVRR